MTKYKDLENNEKKMFNAIEDLFIRSSIKRKSFVKVLGILINKFKVKKQKV